MIAVDNGKINRETGMINRSFVLRMENRGEGRKKYWKRAIRISMVDRRINGFFFCFLEKYINEMKRLVQ